MPFREGGLQVRSLARVSWGESAISPLTFRVVYIKLRALFGANELNATGITENASFFTKQKYNQDLDKTESLA